jgi:colanic acid/amylovoran biosynthesis glycosyltransferase
MNPQTKLASPQDRFGRHPVAAVYRNRTVNLPHSSQGLKTFRVLSSNFSETSRAAAQEKYLYLRNVGMPISPSGLFASETITVFSAIADFEEQGKLDLKIGYLVGEFPKLSETFILDELKEHLRNQVDLAVISLYRPGRDSAARSNLIDFKVPTVYVLRTSGRLQRFERLWISSLALVTHPRLWRVLLGTGFGSRTDRTNILCLAYRLKELKRHGGIDLLHCHFGHRAHLAAALNSLGLIDAKIVTTFHGFDLSAMLARKGGRHYNLLFRIGALFLPISETWARKLSELGCDPARTQVHRVGVDCARNEYGERRLDPRTNAPVKLISVGRLVEKKGHTYILQALAKLHRERPDISVTLDIVGDGDRMSTLKNEATELGLADVVSFQGGLPHNQTLGLLSEAAVFVLPSVTGDDGDMEGIPVSLMEAMAQGMPVISTFHSGIPELIQNGINGLLVPERDVDALAKAIEEMIKDAPRWPEIGRAARKTIESEFDRRKLGHRLVNLYRGLLAQ